MRGYEYRPTWPNLSWLGSNLVVFGLKLGGMQADLGPTWAYLSTNLGHLAPTWRQLWPNSSPTWIALLKRAKENGVAVDAIGQTIGSPTKQENSRLFFFQLMLNWKFRLFLAKMPKCEILLCVLWHWCRCTRLDEEIRKKQQVGKKQRCQCGSAQTREDCSWKSFRICKLYH